MHDDGSEIIFQKAGPDNALGLVKFLFPNEYDVYLHDTPKKALFERPIRAYSHGCMRLDKPLDMAEYLLGKINGMSRKDIDKALEKIEKETYIKLKTPVPVYVEYNTVGAAEDGFIYFYADIYKYDKAYWENQLPVQLAEDLSTDELRSLSKSGEAPVGLDGEGGEPSTPDSDDGP
jgi:murein L,D-transpeptidase YcbB/YkuD